MEKQEIISGGIIYKPTYFESQVTECPVLYPNRQVVISHYFMLFRELYYNNDFLP